MPRRRYTDEFRATALAALAANNGNVKRTARQLGVPVRTLDNWAKGACHPEATDQAVANRGPLADHLRAIAWLLADGLNDPKKVKTAPVNQLAVAFGVVVDKMRLLDGEPTAITQSAPALDLARLTNDELHVLAKLLRSAARPDPGGGRAGPPVAG